MRETFENGCAAFFETLLKMGIDRQTSIGITIVLCFGAPIVIALFLLSYAISH